MYSYHCVLLCLMSLSLPGYKLQNNKIHIYLVLNYVSSEE